MGKGQEGQVGRDDGLGGRLGVVGRRGDVEGVGAAGMWWRGAGRRGQGVRRDEERQVRRRGGGAGGGGRETHLEQGPA